MSNRFHALPISGKIITFILLLVITVSSASELSVAMASTATSSTNTETEEQRREEERRESTYQYIPDYTPRDFSNLTSIYRPIAVTLNNAPGALPQHGVRQAEIIYETLVEGGITRMLAIFPDITELGSIGSIRSSRPYFVNIAEIHDAIFVHGGGSPQALSMLGDRGSDHLDGIFGPGYNAFHRVSERARIHSLFSSGAEVTQAIAAMDLRETHYSGFRSSLLYMPYADPDINTEETDESTRLSSTNTSVRGRNPRGSGRGTDISVRFSSSHTTRFRYDISDNLYYISTQRNERYIDGNNNNQVAVSNVIVIKTDISRIPGDGSGRLSIRITGSGTGYYFNRGRYTEISWYSPNDTSQFEYTLPDGSPLILEYGKTYICIVPIDARIRAN